MGRRGRRGAGARWLLAAGAAAVAVAAALAGGVRAGNYDEGDEPAWTGLFQAVDADDLECVPPPPCCPEARPALASAGGGHVGREGGGRGGSRPCPRFARPVPTRARRGS